MDEVTTRTVARTATQPVAVRPAIGTNTSTATVTQPVRRPSSSGHCWRLSAHTTGIPVATTVISWGPDRPKK